MTSKNGRQVAVYLIEHPNGLVLVDTGWHADVRKDPVKNLGRLHYLVNVPDLPPCEAVHEQLAMRGIKTSDLDYVVVSHMDDDHAGGLAHVADAKNILISELEWESANNIFNVRYRRKLWETAKVKTFQFSPSQYGPVKSAYDIFGDGTVLLIHAPGHSTGMTATLVRGSEKFVLITGDAAYAKKSWDQLVYPGIAPYPKKALNSVGWIKMMSLQEGCAEVLATHDPDVVPHTIELPLTY